MLKKTTTKQISAKPLTRYLSGKDFVRNIDSEARTVELAFSSEEPFERWFGIEILDHAPDSIRLGRLQNGGAVLMDHDRRDHVAVVESVTLGDDRVARALVRFGRSARAEEVFNDVTDGIRNSVSVGYRIYSATLEKHGKEEQDTYRVDDWEPYEISFVSIPADDTVGVGRTAEAEGEENDLTLKNLEEIEVKIMDTNKDKTKAAPLTEEELGKIKTEGSAEERDRATAILAVSERFGQPEIAATAVREGWDLAKFQAAVLDAKEKGGDKPIDPVDIDLTPKETREYSILNGMRASLSGDWSKAGLEQEVHQEICKQLGRESESGFFVPTGIRMNMNRATMVAGTDGVGGHTVETELQSLIELLRNRMVVRSLGAQVLSGLQGDLKFPRQATANTLYWVGENPGSDTSEGNATFDQVPMTPKTAQATTAYSRQLLAQSTLDIEAFVRNDLAQVNALGLDLASIHGTGASNQPAGILATTGIGDVAGGTNGAAPTWSHVVKLETEVSVDNADVGNLSYLTNAKVRGKLKETQKFSGTDGNPVWMDGNTPLNGYGAGVSNQVSSSLTKGTATDASAIIFGNWADLMIGEWGAMEIILDPYALKKQGLVEVTSIMLVDIAVRHPQSFAAMKDALTA